MESSSSTSGSLPLRLRHPLRFIHASDLNLDQSVEGVVEGPPHWEQRYLCIAQQAAERLFQKTLDEEVDFLILSGDVLNANIAPPGLFLFLIGQFERLAKAGIDVYWSGGEFDSPEDWPTAFPLPENVKFFPSNTIQEYYFHRYDGTQGNGRSSNSDGPVAKIVGMSRNQQARRIRSAEFPLDPGGLYTIVVANGDLDPETLAQRRIDYWALGGQKIRQVFHGNPRKKGLDGKAIPLDPPSQNAVGRRDRRDLPPPPYIVHYPGSTIARSPKDLGQFGATLVEVPWGEEPVLTYFPTSPLRWINDQITLDAGDDASRLAEELRIRINNYREAQKNEDLMINWFVDIPPGPLAASLRRGSLTTELLAELRSFFGADFSPETPITWSVDLTLLLPERLAKSFYEQQTILGDFLRSVKHYQDHPGEMLDLEAFLPKNWLKDWEHEDMRHRLLLAEKIELDPDADQVVEAVKDKGTGELHTVASATVQHGSKYYHYTQSKMQAENQHRVLKEAAMIGIELLGNEPKPNNFFAFEPPGPSEVE